VSRWPVALPDHRPVRREELDAELPAGSACGRHSGPL